MDERVAMTQASQQACDDDATGQCGGREESRSEEQGAGEVGEEGEEEEGEVDEDSEEEEMVPVLEHVEIRESMHGGLGLFALKHFTTGDVVVRESPYLAIKHLPWEDVEARLDHASESSRMIREAVEGLDAQNAALFWSFTQTDLYGDLKTPQGVFWTNMIELYKDVAEDEDNEGVSCMFEVTSRLNHACVPSVEWISYAVMTCVSVLSFEAWFFRIHRVCHSALGRVDEGTRSLVLMP